MEKKKKKRRRQGGVHSSVFPFVEEENEKEGVPRRGRRVGDMYRFLLVDEATAYFISN